MSSISFDGIPDDIRTPGQFIEINNSRAAGQNTPKPHKCLIIGQRVAAGTVAAGVIQALSGESIGDKYFGPKSQLAAMCKAWKKQNRYTETDALALDDAGGGTAGTQTLTVTGPATADGVIYFYMGGRRLTLAVTNGQAATAIAANLNAAIQAHNYYPYAPFTSGVASAVVTLTQQNKGTIGNSYDLRFNYGQGEAFPAGVSIAVAAGVTGATDPDLQTALDLIVGRQYDTIVVAFKDATQLAKLANHLLAKWGPMIMKEGMGYGAISGTQSAMTTVGNALNFFPLSLLEIGGVVKGSPTPTYEAAAAYAAECAFQATVDPAAPITDIVLQGVLPPAPTDQFGQPELDTMLRDGLATTFVDPAGGVRIQRAITTYQTNSLGIVDVSYLDSETPRTLAQLRYDVRAMIALKYPRHKLASDGTNIPPGQNVVTPGTLKSEIIALARTKWEGRWMEAIDQFKKELIVVRNGGNPNRVDSRMSPDLINQFRQFAGQLQYLL